MIYRGVQSRRHGSSSQYRNSLTSRTDETGPRNAAGVVFRVLRVVLTVVLVTASTIVVGWVVFSLITGAQLVVFKTGSMSPAMPQGSAAVAVPVLADEIRIGDVVTIERGDEKLPITHRVIEIQDTPPDDSARAFVLQGDANAMPDREPYTFDEAHRVSFVVPSLGTGIALLKSPLGMGVLILGAGVLVTWAFWPGRKAREEQVQT